MYTEFKKNLSSPKLYIFKKLEKEIKTYIEDCENRIEAYKTLIFTPKKNGNEKVNFPLNFSTETGEGHKIDRFGLLRYVTINYDYDYNHNIIGVNIKFFAWNNETNYKKSFESYLSFSYTDFEKWHGGKVNPEEINAKFVYDSIKKFMLPEDEKILKEYKNEYTKLSEDFKKLCEYADKIAEFENSFAGRIVVRSFAYNNFQGQELHYLRTIKNVF